MMIRVCILPQEVNSIQTRSKKNTTAWFVDRHMQVVTREWLRMVTLMILAGTTGAGL